MWTFAILASTLEETHKNIMDSYLKDSISNGNKIEQALIRRWWHEKHNAKGTIVWEYYLEGRYQDAIWFPNSTESGKEYSGRNAPQLHPLKDQEVILCEAKITLSPELIGQALVYKQFAIHADAIVKECAIFSETANDSMINAAKELGLSPVVDKL